MTARMVEIFFLDPPKTKNKLPPIGTGYRRVLVIEERKKDATVFSPPHLTNVIVDRRTLDRSPEVQFNRRTVARIIRERIEEEKARAREKRALDPDTDHGARSIGAGRRALALLEGRA